MTSVPGARFWEKWLLVAFLGAFCCRVDAKPAAPEGSPPVALSPQERAWLTNHPVVDWGMAPDWPPFSSYDKNGNPKGIVPDIVNLVARRTGLHLQLVPTSTWSQSLRLLTTGKIDFAGGMTPTRDRERLYGLQFTEHFCEFPTAVVTRKDMPLMTSMEQLKEGVIALPRDYATTELALEKFPQLHLLITDTEEESMMAVAGNRADGTAVNIASAAYVAHMRGLSNLKISGFTQSDFFLSFGVSKEQPELLSILNKGLDSISQKEREAIFASYITSGTLHSIDWETWRNRAVYAIAAGLAALAAVVAWNRRLANEVEQRKLAETALRRAGAELETRAIELDRRAGQMLQLNESLMRANKDLESFSYSVSHDLKSPLRRLRTFAELLKEEAAGRLENDPREYLEIIHQEARRMSELIEALLAFARIGHARLRYAPVKMDDLVQEVISEIGNGSRQRDIEWIVHPLPDVECDRGLIKQVFANLIDNAVKFTRGRAPARIEIGTLPDRPEDNEVTFYVKDNGAGFDQDLAGRLFGTFQRLHSETDYEGTGIGLANVKRIVERHNGRVWAEGKPGEGATFYFSLPIRQPRPSESAPTQPQLQPADQARR